MASSLDLLFFFPIRDRRLPSRSECIENMQDGVHQPQTNENMSYLLNYWRNMRLYYNWTKLVKTLILSPIRGVRIYRDPESWLPNTAL